LAETNGSAQRGGATILDGETAALFVGMSGSFGKDKGKAEARAQLREASMRLAEIEQTEKQILSHQEKVAKDWGKTVGAFAPTGVIGAAALAYFMMQRKKDNKG
jgi:hypothetical protein